MEDIELLTKDFASARDELAERLNRLREEQDAVKRRYLQGIKNALERVRARHEDLRQAIDDSRELFERPKTRVLHGIRVGLMKQPGRLEIGDQDACVAALRRIFGDEADAYVKVTETPIKKALANLPAKDLKRIGVVVSEDGEAIVIKAADSDIDKLVDALLADENLSEVAR
jgi:hypothetical protein